MEYMVCNEIHIQILKFHKNFPIDDGQFLSIDDF